MKKYNYKKSGIASIPTVLVLMALILSAGILMASISISDNTSVSEGNSSEKALNYAQLGAKDALERIVRNKDYVGTYNLDITPGSCSSVPVACAVVTVSAGSSPKVINVEGQKGDAKRKIQVDANLDSNGLITSYNWQEL
ncbi:MAG: hypothetical protein WAW11_01110 [Patescibacteria group bacterium]